MGGGGRGDPRGTQRRLEAEFNALLRIKQDQELSAVWKGGELARGGGWRGCGFPSRRAELCHSAGGGLGARNEAD